MENKGFIYVFTGNGKGKTSAALGVAVRAVCAGMKVGWVAWYKEESWPISEKELSKYLPIDFYLLGKGFSIANGKKLTTTTKTAPLQGGGMVVDHATNNDHRKAAKAAVNKVATMLASGIYAVIICDEINNALAEGLITWKEVASLLDNQGSTHLVLTGRDADSRIISRADLVTEMVKIKHPYDTGIKAVKGLDF